jgi:hypothetical protein
MKRQVVAVLFAVGLTLLSACVTVVESPSATEPVADSTVTEAPATTEPDESSADGDSPATLRRLQDPSIEQGYLDAVKTIVSPNAPLAENQTLALWQIALNACDFFDKGANMPDWIQANGLVDDQAIDEDEKQFITISVMAVGAVCPEHSWVVDEMAQGLREIEAGEVAP